MENLAADPAYRQERGIEAYARIFDVPREDVPAAMAGRVGQVFAEEAFLAAGGPAWFHPALTDRERSMLIITALAAMMTLVTNYIGQARGSQAMEAVQRVAGSRAPSSDSNEVTP